MKSPTTPLLALTAVLCLSVSGCQDADGETAPSEPPPSGRESAVSGGEAEEYLLTEGELPAGWRDATGQQHLGIPQFCGVVLEPDSLASAKTKRITQGFSGPFIIQYSFVAATEESAARAVDALAEKSQGCTSTEIEGVTATVSPLSDLSPVGEGFSALRATDPEHPQTKQDWVVFRNGTHVTVLVGYGIGAVPNHDDLAEVAQTVAAKG